jgi:hypothetical protein
VRVVHSELAVEQVVDYHPIASMNLATGHYSIHHMIEKDSEKEEQVLHFSTCRY